MDSQTAAKARDKARMIGKSSHHPNYPITFTLYYSLWSLLLATKIGYPDYITNTTDIDLYYAKYELIVLVAVFIHRTILKVRLTAASIAS